MDTVNRDTWKLSDKLIVFGIALTAIISASNTYSILNQHDAVNNEQVLSIKTDLNRFIEHSGDINRERNESMKTELLSIREQNRAQQAFINTANVSIAKLMQQKDSTIEVVRSAIEAINKLSDSNNNTAIKVEGVVTGLNGVERRLTGVERRLDITNKEKFGGT